MASWSARPPSSDGCRPLTRLGDLRSDGKRGLALALSRLKTEPGTQDVQALLDEAWREPKGVALGFTGPPGVGKSTLIGALVPVFRARRLTVGIAAVDPSSRRTGGALLGDRTRIDADAADVGVFVRSFAARERLGGLADLATPAVVLMRALFDLVLIETVGVGQSETEVGEVADAVVLCTQPGAGDALQFMKAGVMEIPDWAVVTKADLGAPAQRAAADLKAALAFAAPGEATPEVLLVSKDKPDTIGTLAASLVSPRSAEVLASRRARQADAFVRQSITARFGREGLAAAGDLARLKPGETPFARERTAAAALRGRLWAASFDTPAERDTQDDEG